MRQIFLNLNVLGNSYVGGAVGNLNNTNISIIYLYFSAGYWVNGTDTVGGLIGYFFYANATNSNLFYSNFTSLTTVLDVIRNVTVNAQITGT